MSRQRSTVPWRSRRLDTTERCCALPTFRPALRALSLRNAWLAACLSETPGATRQTRHEPCLTALAPTPGSAGSLATAGRSASGPSREPFAQHWSVRRPRRWRERAENRPLGDAVETALGRIAWPVPEVSGDRFGTGVGFDGRSGQRQTRGSGGGMVCHVDAVASLVLGLVESMISASNCGLGVFARLVGGEPC